MGIGAEELFYAKITLAVVAVAVFSISMWTSRARARLAAGAGWMGTGARCGGRRGGPSVPAISANLQCSVAPMSDVERRRCVAQGAFRNDACAHSWKSGRVLPKSGQI